jgi:hypothetical protein
MSSTLERMAGHPQPDDGQHSLVDISSIPMVTAGHIDALKDGALALYGSHALGA